MTPDFIAGYAAGLLTTVLCLLAVLSPLLRPRHDTADDNTNMLGCSGPLDRLE